ncbi:MAG: class I SAM-dependent methyltransferase [Chloroflexi bacterium]|nr:class I SAM-dependent methyltransferase [Chloroflexota bacterium]
MPKPANFLFKGMAFTFKIRDSFSPRKNIIADIGIKHGFQILDFGCGPGAYISATEELTGPSGHIYALDAQPMAMEYVQNLCRKKTYPNVTSILSDCATGLRNASIDIVFLYDILHGLTDAKPIFHELHRVIKQSGTLSINDHHMKQEEIIEKVTSSGHFKLMEKKSRTISFSKT